MKRRNVLKGILALFGLPVLEKVKIAEEKVEIAEEKPNLDFGYKDFTMEGWIGQDKWQHFCNVYEGNKVHIYADGYYVKTINSYIDAHGTIEIVRT